MDEKLQKIKEEIKAYEKGFKSLCIASLDAKGNVLCTYAPFIKEKGCYFALLSEVADHFHAIEANPKNIEVMLIEDESKAGSVFARLRLRYRVEASLINREKPEFDELYERFSAHIKENQITKMLHGIKDFMFFKLTPLEGRFVKGFGAAYDIKIKGEDIELLPARPVKPHSTV